MKRTFLAFALAVTMVASLAACSSRPADTNNGTSNNGTSNNGTSNNGTSNNGTTNNGTSNGTTNNGTSNGTTSNGTSHNGTSNGGSGSGSTVGDGSVMDDGIMGDEFVDDNAVNDGVMDMDPMSPVTPEARARRATHRSGAYYADCNGNLADWEDSSTIGDAARTAVDGVVNGVRRTGDAVGDMAYNLTHR